MSQTQDARPYGSLTESERVAELRARHRDYYLDLAEKSETELRGADQAAWRRLLDSEHDNLVQALEWSIDDKDEGSALRLAIAVNEVWYLRGDETPPRQWLERALGVGSAPSALRSTALRHLSFLIMKTAERPLAHRLARESLEVARQAGDREAEATSLVRLGINFPHEEGGAEAAKEILRQALALATELGDELLIADTKYPLGWREARENPAGFHRKYLDSLEIYRRLGDRESTAWLLFGLAWGETDLSVAETYAEEAMVIARELENDALILCVIELFAFIDFFAGDYDAARAHWEAGVAEYRKPGRRWPILWGISWMLGDLTIVDIAQGELDLARARVEEALEISHKLESKPGFAAWCKWGLGYILMLQGEARGRSLLDEGIALEREIGIQQRLGSALYHLAHASLSTGDLPAAREAYEESLTISRQGLDTATLVRDLSHLARVHEAEGDLDAAEALLAEALELATGKRGGPPLFWRPVVQTSSARIERLRGDLEKSDQLSSSALARLNELGHTPHLASTVEERAALAAARGEHEKAARIYGAAEALRRTIKVPVPSHQRRAYDEEVERLKSGIERDAFESAWREGSALDLDEALALAAS